MPMSRNITLSIVAANGTKVTLYANDLAAMASYTSNGGTRSSTGTLANFGAYTGVSFVNLCNLVGGVSSSNTIKVTGSDGYSTTYSYGQLTGQGVGTYDSTGNQVNATKPLTMIVAYYLNGTSLASGAGPLRTIIVGSESLYTTGSVSAKMVVKIEIL